MTANGATSEDPGLLTLTMVTVLPAASDGERHLAASKLLAEARRMAGVSQRELAVRAGVSPSSVSAYEQGQRQPPLPVVLRLLDACGVMFSLDLAVPAQRRRVLIDPATRATAGQPAGGDVPALVATGAA